ncbi:MAG TPA: DUF6382 domain-containing protein [Anaerovoracaceae bacterium]|nr:DUF6382 domain-containing protein [Anaerovoracaceae bacterium]
MEGNRIRFISGEAEIEESAGRRKFSLTMEERVKEYEKRMLGGSQCPYILPMYFLTEDGKDTAYYDFTGMIQLKDYIGRQASDSAARENRKPVCGALDTLSGILGCIKGMENHLIFPERITAHPDAVFIDPDNGKIALAYYPCGNPELTLQSRIPALLDEMDALYRDIDTGQYFRKLKDFIHLKNPGLDGMIGMLGTMQREASYIYWNTGSFRKAEETGPAADHYTDSRHGSVKQNACAGKKLPPVKLIGVQAVFLGGLAATFLSGAFDLVSVAGLAVIAAALDVWLMRKLQYR